MFEVAYKWFSHFIDGVIVYGTFPNLALNGHDNLDLRARTFLKIPI